MGTTRGDKHELRRATPATAADIAARVSADEEDTYHALVHIAESGKANWALGECPCCDTFAKA